MGEKIVIVSVLGPGYAILPVHVGILQMVAEIVTGKTDLVEETIAMTGARTQTTIPHGVTETTTSLAATGTKSGTEIETTAFVTDMTGNRVTLIVIRTRIHGGGGMTAGGMRGKPREESENEQIGIGIAGRHHTIVNEWTNGTDGRSAQVVTGSLLLWMTPKTKTRGRRKNQRGWKRMFLRRLVEASWGVKQMESLTGFRPGRKT